MVIDFRKLNKSTRKDHYHLPFINQMLERLSKHIPSSTHLPGNGAKKELDVYYATLFLQTRVGPPRAEFCRTVAIFPQVDDLRFINLWEAQDEDGLSQTTLQPNTRNLLCPQHTQYNGKLYGALVQRRDGDTSVVWIVDIGFCNMK